MSQLPALNHLSHAEKDALIQALWAQVQGLLARVAALEAKLGEPSKNSDNSSLPGDEGAEAQQAGEGQAYGAAHRQSGPQSMPLRRRGAVAARWPAIPTKR
jgi:hypothetical protein